MRNFLLFPGEQEIARRHTETYAAQNDFAVQRKNNENEPFPN